jgi:putative spermidine/putrescine transport system ATP-binding protein
MTQLHLANLVKRFGDVSAVDGIDLTVEPGKLVALLGPSGCGKTTTLRMIAGLEMPTEGDVRFDADSVVAVPPHKREIGMVFQRYVLFPHMSVAGNISFGLRMKRMPRDEIDRRVTEILDVVQLTGLADRFPSQLSGGQQQRVAIARTIVTDPRVMLMDEPLANLDAKLREEMRSFITRLQRRLDITTVFVTHDQVEAIELADQIGVMFDGRIVQFGTPESIFNRPTTPRIAEFMGATNLLEGDVAGAAGGAAAIETPVGRFEVAAGGPEGAGRLATIRPEHVHLDAPDDATPAATVNSFRAVVDEGVYYGGIVSYRIRSGDTTLTVRDRSTRRFEAGEEVVVRLPSEHLWIFPDQPDAA